MREEELREKEQEILVELEEYHHERAKVKEILGRIGGQVYSKVDFIINIAFLTTILVLFVLELTTKWLPSMISLELGILLVSIKIVWMIYFQNKHNHFQFWVLNSIEFRINDVVKRVKHLENLLAGDTEEKP